MFEAFIFFAQLLAKLNGGLFIKLCESEAVFLVSLRMSSFPAGNEVYGKSIESSFLTGNELAPRSFPA